MRLPLSWLRKLLERMESRDFQLSSKWFLLSMILGVVVGLVTVVFDHLSLFVETIVLRGVVGFNPGEAEGEFDPFASLLDLSQEPEPWILLLVVTLGGLLSGYLLQRFATDASGSGTGATIHAFHFRQGYLRWQIVWVKILTTSITVGTGGSGGREGPIAQIGAALGAWLGQRLHLTRRDRRILLAAGMGAGVGAIFRAPLAGALFAAEILYKDADFEAEVIVPAAMSSIIAYGVYSMFLPQEIRYMPLFGQELRFNFLSPFELIPYTIMAIVIVFVGILFTKTYHNTHNLFEKIKLPLFARVGLGAFSSGVITLLFFFSIPGQDSVMGIAGRGYGTLQNALTGAQPLAIGVLAAIVLGKIVATSFTVGSGGSGGVFGPSMVIGGCTGVAVAQFLQPLFPEGLIHQPQAYGVVGMAGFIAGCINAPISTIIMVSELTGEYKLLIPTMWVSTLCFLMMRKHNLYLQQVHSRLESPAHRGDFIVDVLEGIRVEEVYRKNRPLRMIPESMPLEQIVHIVADTHQHYYPVVDEKGRLVGIFSSDDVRAYLYNEHIWSLANAGDVMTVNPITITADDNLNTALMHFTMKNLDELPVVSSTDRGIIIGMLRRKETIACYNRRLVELKQSYNDEDSVLVTPKNKP